MCTMIHNYQAMMKSRRRSVRKRSSLPKKRKTVHIKRKRSKRRVNQKGEGIFSVLVPLIATAISAAVAK